ncbi:hypothetical protein SDC9_204217 [bioreactor metagenome]|uniref:Uncharacterized protein n=1 Tax=bioreactor metagenome TaxID=1076179 RepID=A0A645IZD3_9ZZZZ|nr:hypothetical protein [Candidatus Metalachnospira sp.]
MITETVFTRAKNTDNIIIKYGVENAVKVRTGEGGFYTLQDIE